MLLLLVFLQYFLLKYLKLPSNDRESPQHWFIT